MKATRAAAIAVLLHTGVALAQQSPEVRRHALVEQALAARAHGDHARAVDFFLQAGSIQMRPGLRFSLAEEYEALGDHRSACQQAVDCVAAIASDPSHAESRTITEGCPAIAQSACGAVGQVEVRLPSSVPAGLEVVVAGRRIDLLEDGDIVAVEPGTVVVQASGSGVRSFRQAVTLRAGERREVDVTFNEALATAASTRTPVAMASTVSDDRVRSQIGNSASEPTSEGVTTHANDYNGTQVSASERPSAFTRVALDIGGGLGLAILPDSPDYAEESIVLVNGQPTGIVCGTFFNPMEYYCPPSGAAGLASTGFLSALMRVDLSRRVGIGAGVRYQFDTAANSTSTRSTTLPNFLIFGRLYYAPTGRGFMPTGYTGSLFVGGGIGQIEPKPSSPYSESSAHVLSGLGNFNFGARVEYGFGYIHVAAELALNFMFPNFLFDTDLTGYVGLNF